ncbi:hypothetical protein GWK08_13440 [Leptobacterium flavescens]|uniref:Uncharacterized protein n=1 Tax=Leptobacterium flavescens TaxID=472055 RepID=A0A6P0UPM3_9FLAO|nr:hypothetical protein [Leptobacterium flavescens]NER14452.1 hypothetical protein [Leptobacterium flavescens]
MDYYLIALAIYFVLFIVSTYFTSANFRRFISDFVKAVGTKWTVLKNAIAGSKGLVVSE